MYELQKKKYFNLQKYITYLEKTHYDDMKTLSYCELNLETWRQLWRVLELSDIVLIIVDIRFPVYNTTLILTLLLTLQSYLSI